MFYVFQKKIGQNTYFFVVFWGLVKSKKTAISLILLILGFSYYPSMFQLKLGESEHTTDSTSFKLLSYNVRLFDLYGWRDGKETRDQIMSLIEQEQPDILCIQEFFHSDERGYFSSLKRLKNMKKSRHKHLQYIDVAKRTKHHWGIATFSKYPIINKGQILFENQGNDLCIFTDLKINDDTLRVYNLHCE